MKSNSRLPILLAVLAAASLATFVVSERLMGAGPVTALVSTSGSSSSGSMTSVNYTVTSALGETAPSMAATSPNYSVRSGILMVGVAQSTGMVPPILAPFLALTGRVGLTGSSRPADGWQVPVTVKLFPSGANPLVDTALHTYLATTIQAGTVAAFTITGVPPGTYDISVDSEHTLMNLKRDAVVSGSVVVVDLGSLLEGDADDNEVVNVLDFTLLAASFLVSSGQGGFDPRADFDSNGTVNILDFTLLVDNFFKASPIIVP